MTTFQKAINTVRVLSAEGVEKANSGHPGMPIGCADFAFTLWYKHMRMNPENASWMGRDRYVQSAGHGSMLQYTLLHLFGYNVPMDELKNFRQWKSATPGHPEFGHTDGVEVTTGPLGTGLASAVGMAIAAKQLAARMGNETLFDQKIFVISGDGCLMEGVSHEAASLAGHNQLDNLILFYDSNSITIEGATDLAYSDDVEKRFASYGWNVIKINGNDPDQCDAALTAAKAHTGGPTIIIGTTKIAFGCPNKAGSHKTHGAPLGADEIAAMKAAFGLPGDTEFFVDDDVRELCGARVKDMVAEAKTWERELADFFAANPEKKELYKALTKREMPADLLETLTATVDQKAAATRKSGGATLQKIAALIPAVTGGSADLNPSTNTHMDALTDFSPACREGRNIHFGVREFAMGLAANGIALYGTGIPYTATFAVFADFMKPAMRLAAIQKIKVIFIFTHDSIFVGEDGPTHQPIEQMAMCRSIPGLTVLRPAEANEVAHAWAAALACDGPVAMFLTRQNIEPLPAALRPAINVAKGAYVLSDDENPQACVIATGSEVLPALGAAEILRGKGRALRVVSMPSMELFDAQDQAYKDQVIPPCPTVKRVIIEAGTTFGWGKYADRTDLIIGLDHFGDSAPAELLEKEYGLDAESLAARIDDFLA
ncbi:MAG: transketolase [Lentisphaeria bacterium]|nr:transketolase [Lentisphaeria bacterium]